jgi:hypothetical protein
MASRLQHPAHAAHRGRPPRTRRARLPGAAAGCIGALLAGLLAAPDLALADDATTPAKIDVKPAMLAAPAQPPKSGKPQIVAVPIPMSDPALGSGLTVVAAPLYEPKGSGGVWTTGVGGLYTSNGSYGVFLGQKAHFKEDLYRVSVAAAYANFNLKFYGLGGPLASSGKSIGINQTGLGVFAQGMRKVAPNTYFGASYTLIDAKTTLDIDPATLPPALAARAITIPKPELDSVTSALGLAGEYDTRDSEYGTRSGIYATGGWRLADPAIGSKFGYNKLEVASNFYFPVSANTVVAARVNVCGASSKTPFYDLCLFGQSNSLRGYATGQYRDNAAGAAQVEVRQHLFWRIGAVAFAGVGGTAPAASRFGQVHVLPSGGVGLRFMASKEYKLNLSVDVAAGRHSKGFYVYIGESF